MFNTDHDINSILWDVQFQGVTPSRAVSLYGRLQPDALDETPPQSNIVLVIRAMCRMAGLWRMFGCLMFPSTLQAGPGR